MRICRYWWDDEVRWGVVDDRGDEPIVRDPGPDPFQPAAVGVEVAPLVEVILRAPVDRPSKIVGIGLNYRDHAAEVGLDVPGEPMLFAMWANAIVGPDEPILLPAVSEAVDYEAELGVVIGRTAHDVEVDHALDHVWGYTCLNDVSARDRQAAEPRWVRAKSLDTFCPIGPWLVTADEIPDPQALGIRGVVNDEVRQDSSTAEMVFGVAELVSYITRSITLEPGDVIATGTPAGVGHTRVPPVFLRHGDVVTVEIDGIGRLTNPVVGPTAG